jgi:hypothetical protein
MSRQPSVFRRFHTVEPDATQGRWKKSAGLNVIPFGGTSIATSVATTAMALPLPTPKPPVLPRLDEYAGLEDLGRVELDEAPDTDPMLVPIDLDWDGDSDSGIVRKH